MAGVDPDRKVGEARRAVGHRRAKRLFGPIVEPADRHTGESRSHERRCAVVTDDHSWSHDRSLKEQALRMGNVVVRQCRDEAELEELYRSIGRQFGEEWDASDRRLDEPRSRFDRDRDLIFALVDGTRIRGGVIAFGDEIVTVRAVGIDAELRGQGHGRRLLELVEGRALVRGARTMVVGAADEARGFYDRMGFRGKRTMHEKHLPPPGAVRSRLAARAAAAYEELSLGG